MLGTGSTSFVGVFDPLCFCCVFNEQPATPFRGPDSDWRHPDARVREHSAEPVYLLARREPVQQGALEAHVGGCRKHRTTGRIGSAACRTITGSRA